MLLDGYFLSLVILNVCTGVEYAGVTILNVIFVQRISEEALAICSRTLCLKNVSTCTFLHSLCLNGSIWLFLSKGYSNCSRSFCLKFEGDNLWVLCRSHFSQSIVEQLSFLSFRDELMKSDVLEVIVWPLVHSAGQYEPISEKVLHSDLSESQKVQSHFGARGMLMCQDTSLSCFPATTCILAPNKLQC